MNFSKYAHIKRDKDGDPIIYDDRFNTAPVPLFDSKEKALIPTGDFKAVTRYKPNPKYDRKTLGRYGYFSADINKKKTIKYDDIRFEMRFEGKLYWLPMVTNRLEGTKTISKIGKQDLDNYFPYGITSAYKEKDRFTFLYAPKALAFEYFEKHKLIKA